MMDSAERVHHRTTTSSTTTTATTTELFICFTSRLSSSMKISSKSSVLSPARARDPPSASSLSASLSRRLRTNRSLRGAQSPMFPTGGKKRSSAFENPEPSSPKVTCIGQVRVKTRKQGNKIRTLSRRRGGGGGGGDVRFRRVGQTNQSLNSQNLNTQESLPHKNQRWVHLPLTICEGLKTFGSELSCLFPCFSNHGREKEERGRGSSEGDGRSSCGAAFTRWLVAVQDSEGGKGREIELVVEEEEDVIATETKGRTLGRHAVEELEYRDEKFEEEGRVSICVPPKNALLLMRCRSDPMRMEALTNRFLESASSKREEEEGEDAEELAYEGVEEAELLKLDSKLTEFKEEDEVYDQKMVSIEANGGELESQEADANIASEAQETEVEDNPDEEKLEINEEVQEANQTLAAEETELNGSSYKDGVEADKLENEDALLIQEREEEEEEELQRRQSHHSSSAVSAHSDLEEEEEKSTELEKETQLETEEHVVTQHRSESESEPTHANVERERSSLLPECLLLMRCEPKLSMEVSKETWVCSMDFIRRLPERHANAKNRGDGPKIRANNRALPPQPARRQQLQQPPRSSCSLPAAVAGVLGEKLVGPGGFEPFGLTRCNSEPMRTAAAKLAPETCFWKNTKLEPHRRATVGTAGVGF